MRVECADGTPAVLKVFWPHREAEQEADALERWDGEGAVRLLARDDERSALLLERCEPGSFLSTADDPVGVLIELLPRLWRSGEGFCSLEAETLLWEESLDETTPALPGPRTRLRPRARAHAGRAGARQPGPARGERARRGARAVARDRSEAARRRARVLRRVDRALAGARPQPARRASTGSTGSPRSSGSSGSARRGGRSRRRSPGRAAATTSKATWTSCGG